MRVGVVDIGTNSMRLLVTDGAQELGRWVEVTGLGKGVDASGRLEADAVARTIDALERFGEIMDGHDVEKRAAIATSATRDAANREAFLERATAALGVGPEMIRGDREGELAYEGATADLDGGPYVVSDIGGGSTEFVSAEATVSLDVGSVRLTDRVLTDRPASRAQMEQATAHVAELFSGIAAAGELVGVAGTWTSLAGIDLELPEYEREKTHHHRLSREAVDGLVEHLAGMTLDETAAIPSLDPGRAPVILAGAVIASCVIDALDAEAALVSERDSLDGLAMELLDVT